ncbi:MAG: hypothetical protein JW834_01440 [Candidatus Diapherotrites archaeon]|nr:hypothetical protein [Candidatus Diapherotrites archaeon]
MGSPNPRVRESVQNIILDFKSDDIRKHLAAVEPDPLVGEYVRRIVGDKGALQKIERLSGVDVPTVSQHSYRQSLAPPWQKKG